MKVLTIELNIVLYFVFVWNIIWNVKIWSSGATNNLSKWQWKKKTEKCFFTFYLERTFVGLVRRINGRTWDKIFYLKMDFFPSGVHCTGLHWLETCISNSRQSNAWRIKFPFQFFSKVKYYFPQWAPISLQCSAVLLQTVTCRKQMLNVKSF